MISNQFIFNACGNDLKEIDLLVSLFKEFESQSTFFNDRLMTNDCDRWIVTKFDIKINKIPSTNSVIIIEDYTIEINKAYTKHIYLFKSIENDLLLIVNCVLCVYDILNKKIKRINSYILNQTIDHINSEYKIENMTLAQGSYSVVSSIRINENQTDHNNHLNNIEYLKIMSKEINNNKKIDKISLAFHKQLLENQKIIIKKNNAKGDYYKFVDEDGNIYFSSVIEYK